MAPTISTMREDIARNPSATNSDTYAKSHSKAAPHSASSADPAIEEE
jgi:hypothetical protein